MSFSNEFERLLVFVDAGVSVKAAAVAVGVSQARAYRLLRESGRGLRRPKTKITDGVRGLVLEEFRRSGSINRAALRTALSHSAARRILVQAGLVPAETVPASKPRERGRFLELIEEGWSTARAAREVGVHPRTARDWRRGIRKVGNTRVHPDGTVVDYGTRTRYATTMTVSVVSERYLSIDDRLVIADGLIHAQTLTAIAARVGKHKSTISREVSEHSVAGLYLPHRAHRDAAVARARPKASKLVEHTSLREQVEQGLENKLSPEQISNRQVKDFPDDPAMRVSHETIYQALYFQARGGLKREVQAALRTGRTRRKPHRQPGQRTHRFIDPMVMISDRPAEVEDRAVPGHWEGDLIMGAANATAIGTLVERTTRYTLLVHLPGGHDAEHVRDQLIATITTLPGHLRGSLTWDQGAEMARHLQFKMATDMPVYFCDPASPWQRGTNENTNGLLRQYFPKGTDLSVYSLEDLEHVAQQLNARPRKTLDWDTPAERLRDLLTT